MNIDDRYAKIREALEMGPAMTETTPDYAGLSRRLGALAYHIQQTGMTDGQDAQTCLEVDYALSTLRERNKQIAALEAERDRLKERVAELEKVREVAVDALKWLSNAARYDKTVTIYAVAAMSQINGYSGGSV